MKPDFSKNSIPEKLGYFCKNKPSGKATSDVSVTCICESASQSSLFDKRTKVVFNENSSATGSETCWARIGNVKSTAALGLPKKHLYWVRVRIQFRVQIRFWAGIKTILENIDDPKVSMARNSQRSEK